MRDVFDGPARGSELLVNGCLPMFKLLIKFWKFQEGILSPNFVLFKFINELSFYQNTWENSLLGCLLGGVIMINHGYCL